MASTRRSGDLDELETKKAICALLASALSFSLMTVCIKFLNGRLPVAEIVFSRAVISLLITRAMLKNANVSPWGTNKILLLVRGLLGTCALFCVFKAIAILPLTSATIIQYSYPTFTALAAGIILRERIEKNIWIALLLGWSGITIIVKPDWLGLSSEGLPLFGVLIALGGALLTALAYVCVRKLSTKEHPLVIVYYFPLVSIPVTLPFILEAGLWPLGIEWLLLLGIGILTQAGQIWITKGLTQLPAAKATTINYIQVLFAALWSIVLFGETIDISIILGAFLVFIATLLSISSK